MTNPPISSDEALRDAIAAIKTLPDDCFGYVENNDNDLPSVWPIKLELLDKMEKALSRPAAPLPEVGADRVTADDFWPIHSTESANEPITRPRIDWWWLCKKIEFQRRELKQLNEWLKVYRDREAALNPQGALKQEVELFEKCPQCSGDGWYVVPDGNAQPMQEQCGYCMTSGYIPYAAQATAEGE